MGVEGVGGSGKPKGQSWDGRGLKVGDWVHFPGWVIPEEVSNDVVKSQMGELQCTSLARY